MDELARYARALGRGWRLLLVLVVVGGVVAVLAPQGKGTKVAAKTKAASATTGKYDWRAASVVGSLPPQTGIGQPAVDSSTILFWANNFYTKGAAVTGAGQGSSAGELIPLMKASTVGIGATIGKSGGGTGKGSGKGAAKTSTAATAKSSSGSYYVRLAVGGTSAQAATDLANSYAKTVEGAVNAAYATYRKSLTATQKLTQPNSSSGFVIVAPALASGAVKLKSPKVVYKPPLGRRKAGLFGAGLGLLLGVLILLVRELLNRSVQSAAATESSFLYPVVAEIPERPAKGPGSTAGLLGVVEEPTSPAAEAYRMLRMSVLFEGLAPAVAPDDLYGAAEGPSRSLMRGPYQAPSPGSRQVVLVVSAGSEDSRPVVAANLSAAYAEAGERVIVISTGDLDAGYRPGQTVDRTTDIEAWELAAKLEPSNLENVARLSLRPFVASSGLLAARAPGIFAAARRLADVVIVEAPPLLAVHHGEALVHAVDVVVVVAESRSTKMDDARRAGEVLRRMGAPVLGVALTRVRLSAGDVRQASGPPGLPRPTEPPGPVHQPIQESTRA